MSERAARDMSEAQFRTAAEKLGFRRDFLGYWELPKPYAHVSVYRFNGGLTRRAQLAYLLAQVKKQEKAETDRQSLAEDKSYV